MNRPRTRLTATCIVVVMAVACDGTKPSNTPPVAAFTAQCSQLACSFENASTDSDGVIAASAWSFGDGENSTDESPEHKYAVPGGEFTVTVAVTDNDGAHATASQLVTVSPPDDSLAPMDDNHAPLAAFSVTCAGLTCTFSNESSDPDAGDSVVSLSWYFGDGKTSTEPSPQHTYEQPGGRFAVSLWVSDRRGALANATTVLEAIPDAPPPHAGQIAFVRDGRIYRANTDGTGLVQLSAGPADSEPAWSPDGSRIAFTRGGEAAGIYVMTADGANLVRRAVPGKSPTWSPDGQWIAFACRDGSEYLSAAICKVSADVDGTGPVMIMSTTFASVLNPAWSPDGAHIAFSSDWTLVDFWLDIWVVSADGTRATALRSHDSQPQTDQLQPAWSPDGGRIAIVACPNTWSYCDAGSIRVMNADGSGLMELTKANGYAHPTWSPDGQTIAFANGNAIEWISADGSQRGRIIENGASPAWRP